MFVFVLTGECCNSTFFFSGRDGTDSGVGVEPVPSAVLVRHTRTPAQSDWPTSVAACLTGCVRCKDSHLHPFSFLFADITIVAITRA